MKAAEITPAASSSAAETSSQVNNSANLDRGTWRRRVAAIAVIATVVCAADLVSKRWVFDWLGVPPEHRVHWIVEDYFGFETSINTGALGGIGSGHTAALAVISILATVGILIWVFTGGAVADRVVTLAVGLILGGIWGNLYDRLGLWGISGVRDWILLKYGSFVWPNFNIADSMLVCGSALLILHAFRSERQS